MDYALFGYPLTNGFRERFEQSVGGRPHYLMLGELRRLSMMSLVKRLRGLGANRLFIAMENSQSQALLPTLYCLAALSDARRIQVVGPDLQFQSVSRWEAWRPLVATLGATVSGAKHAARCWRELNRLKRQPKVPVISPAPGRILYAKTNLSFGVTAGGSVGHVAGVTKALGEAGYPVDFFAIEPPVMAPSTLRYHCVPAPSAYGLPYDANLYRYQNKFVRQTLRWASNNCPKFVYQRLSIGNYAGVVQSRRSGIPLVLEYNGSEVWIAENWGVRHRLARLARLAEEVSLQHAHVVVTVSDVLRDELIQRGVEAERIVTHPNGFDPDVFSPQRFSADELAAVRRKHGIAEDAVVAMFLGTFGQWHGVEVLADAVRRLALHEADWLRRHRIHFLIVGDGVGMRQVQQILSNERCRPFYTLPGLIPQNEAPAHLAAADILLSPHVENADGSRFFGSPTKLFEYMAMGKAIVASDLDQIGQVLRNSLRVQALPVPAPQREAGELAVLCRPGGVEDLQRGLVFLAENPKWRETLGRNVRREALSKYTWEKHVGAILENLAVR